MPPEDFVQLGFIRAAHGLRGQIVVHMFSGDRAALSAYGPLCNADGKQTYTIQVTGEKNGDFLCKMDNITDRNAAEDLRGTKLYVSAAALPEPDEDDFYIKDLIGLKAIAADGTALGEVINVTHLGQHDALEVRFTHDGVQELAVSQTEYVLFLRDTVPNVDIKGGTVTLTLPEGMFTATDQEKPA